MRFFIDTTQSMSQSVLVKNKDNSFSCLNNELDWDFQVKIEPFVVLILNINSNSKQCIGIISSFFFAILILCIAYIIKEILRRKHRIKKKEILEANYDIRISIIFCGIGVLGGIGVTIAHYLNLFTNNSVDGYMWLCLVCLAFIVIAFACAYRKVIINTKMGIVSIYRTIPIKINVKEITLIKHTRDGWKVFSKHKKIFALCDRRDSYPIEFYKWIVEKSCCEEERPKGYVGRNDKF